MSCSLRGLRCFSVDSKSFEIEEVGGKKAKVLITER